MIFWTQTAKVNDRSKATDELAQTQQAYSQARLASTSVAQNTHTANASVSSGYITGNCFSRETLLDLIMVEL
jgi:hypothetical protein